MKILLCLLSEQHIPNLLSVHHFQPDKLVLVETKQMKARHVADHLLTALDLGGLDYRNRCHVQPLEVEDDLASVRSALQAAYGNFPSDQWIANLTGGTKPMSIATHEFFKALGGRLVYTNVARPSRLIDMTTNREEECGYRPTIKEFLAGYGFESRKKDAKLHEAEQRASEWAHSATLLAQYAGKQNEDILDLDDEERKQARSKGIELKVDRFHFPSDSLREIWIGDGTTRKLTKYEAEFLTGGWLEVFFWQLLTRHAADLGLWDVRLGLEVGRVGDPSGNDFDVAFMHNFGLSMIECKSGSQSHDPGGEILYKVDAVKRQFGALRVRSYLATTGTNVLDKEGNLKPSLKSRAEIYQCRILLADQIGELAKAETDPKVVRTVFLGERSPV